MNRILFIHLIIFLLQFFYRLLFTQLPRLIPLPNSYQSLPSNNGYSRLREFRLGIIRAVFLQTSCMRLRRIPNYKGVCCALDASAIFSEIEMAPVIGTRVRATGSPGQGIFVRLALKMNRPSKKGVRLDL